VRRGTTAAAAAGLTLPIEPAPEAWAQHHLTVRKHLELPDNEMVFAGMSVGYEDPDARINAMRADRAPAHEFLAVHAPSAGKL